MLSQACVTSNFVLLKVEPFCKDIITFSNWKGPERLSGLQDTPLNVPNSNLTALFDSTNRTLCPIMSFGLNVIQGREEDIQIDPDNMSLIIPKLKTKVLKFTLTACTTEDPNECHTSEPISLTVLAVNSSEYVLNTVSD